MANTCAHCSRVNPAGAVYCYFDGSALNGHASGAPQNIGSQAFPTPFVFPSGKSCRSFDQLATACQHDWAGAVELLRTGVLEQFFGGLGRADLAQAARAAAGFPDAERGLDQLLDRFPTQVLQPPQLAVEPTEINLGSIKADADHQFEVVVSNQGMRLLYGSVVSNTPWLSLGEGQGGGQKLFQTGTETTIQVTVRSRFLHAGNKPLEGRLIVESNGGRQTVMVKATVPARPFPDGVLEGALTPRQLAEKAKAAPKDAARFFENGTVARWYQLNGWTYPVQGPAASGLGAVQQFFEALGLAKPPRVELTETALELHGQPGEKMRRYLQVKTAEKRPVFASAASDQAWLTVGPIQLTGPVATIPLDIAAIPDEPGQVLQARVTVTANGGQRFVVPVSLTVANTGAIRALPVAAVTRAPVDTAVEIGSLARSVRPIHAAPGVPVRKRPLNDRDDPDSSPGKKYLLLAGLLLLLLLGGGGLLILLLSGSDGTMKTEIAVKDDPAEEKHVHKVGGLAFESKVQDEPEERTGPLTIPVKATIGPAEEERTRPVGPQPVKVEIKDEPGEGGPGQVGGPIDPDLRVAYAYGPNQSFGITAVKDQAGQFLNKRLTYAPNGQTNRTMLRINGFEALYGAPTGQWIAQGLRFPDDPGRQSKATTVSVLQINNFRGKPANLRVSQALEVMPSKQPVAIAPGVRKRLLDTVLIRYQLENADPKKGYMVGLRVQVDTLIGGNDGVPFTIPGYAGLVGTFADFKPPKKIPAFVQALEVPDLRNPGTIAHMTLKVGGGVEPPGRVSLTCWRADNGRYEVPIQPLAGDSCVVLYWPDKLLKAGEKRILGFAYGLGAVDAGEGAGSLGITLGGSFEPGQIFTVTAYVNNPRPKQTVTLEVPEGLEIQDKATVTVPRPEGNPPTSVVTWSTKVLQTGEFKIRVKSNTGVAQTKTISIVRPDAPTGKLRLALDGKYEPGEFFTVTARVSGVTPKQQLQLHLPKGLERAEGEETQPVPAPAEKDGESAVVWKVKVLEPGKHPVRVSSNTGIAQTKTLTIERADASAGRFVLTLGSVEPGQPFVVSALVPDPLENQTLTLKLDPRMKLLGGDEVQKVPPGSGGSRVNWNVQVDQPGKYTLRVESSHGLALKKTIALERGDENAGKFVLGLSGTIAPGKEFKVIGTVASPVAGQRLTLKLPPQLQLMDGAAEQTVLGTTPVTWTVRVLEAGTLRVRVESTTGYARSKTITITQVQDAAAIFGK